MRVEETQVNETQIDDTEVDELQVYESHGTHMRGDVGGVGSPPPKQHNITME